MSVFIFFELLSYITISINFLSGFATSHIKLLPTIIGVVYILLSYQFLKDSSNNLKATLFLAFVADIFFIVFKIPVLGVEAFILAQLCNFFYLCKISDLNMLLLLGGVNLLLYVMFGNNILIFEAIIYALLSVTNLFISRIKIRDGGAPKEFFWGLICLFICDLSVALLNSFSLSTSIYKLLNIIEWSFYIPYLLVIVKIISYDYYYFTDKNIELPYN